MPPVAVFVALLGTTSLAPFSSLASVVEPFAATSPVAASPAAPVLPYQGQMIVRVEPGSVADLELALAVATDVLTHRPGVGPVDVMLDANARARLDAAGIHYRVIVDDVARQVERERQLLLQPLRADASWIESYHDASELDARLDQLASAHADLASVFEIGSSVEGVTIRGLRISASAGDKPSVVLQAMQHAREWISPMVAFCTAEALLDGHASDPAIAGLLETLEVFVIPVVNPDGYQFSRDEQRYWRKNRGAPSGIDLNRNWGEGWGLDSGSSDDVESDAYRGTEPFSEPETAAVRAFAESLPQLRTLADIHSYGAMVASSWAYKNDPPDDIALLRAWGGKIVDQFNAHGKWSFVSLHSVDANQALGNASGTAPDWAHGQLNVPAFTVELPPDRDDQNGWGFVLPPEEIAGACEQTVPGLIELLHFAAGEPTPTVEITSPVDNAAVAGAFEVSIDAAYRGPVAEVTLWVDGMAIDPVDTLRPFLFDAVELAAGAHTLTATATTWDGKTAESAAVEIVVTDAPGDDDDDGSTAGDDDDDDDDDSTTGQPSDRGTGCGCTVGGPGLGGTALVGLGLGLTMRRRRLGVRTR